MVSEKKEQQPNLDGSDLSDPVGAWDVVWNLDQNLRPWDELSMEEQMRWATYVRSGGYAAARAKRAIDVCST